MIITKGGVFAVVLLVLSMPGTAAMAQGEVNDDDDVSAAAEIAEQIHEEARRSAQADEDEPEVDIQYEVDTEPTSADDLVDEVIGDGDRLRNRLTLTLAGNIDGNFARVDCRQEQDEHALYWAKQASYFHALDGLAAGSDLAAPVALNVGNTVFPGILGRYLLSQGESGAHRLAELLGEVPADVHGLGAREFAAPRAALVDFVEAAEERGIDMQAANLECESFGAAEGICAAAGGDEDSPKFRVIERDGIRLAVTTVLAQELLDTHADHQREGVNIGDPSEVVGGLIDEMREQADLVIVQHQVPRMMAAPLAYDLGKEVEGIDLIVASHLIEDHTSGTRFDPDEPSSGGRMEIIEAPSTGTPIVSANSTQFSAINVELDLIGDAGDDVQWAIRRVIPRRVLLEEMPRHPSTKQLLESAIGDMCGDWGEPLSDNAGLDEPFEMADLQRFILNIMRFSTRSELALSNRQAFRSDERFPLTKHLTTADIFAALPYENELVTVDISGSVLAGLADRLSSDVVGAGIAVVDGDVKINGRTPNPDRRYRVALNDYLADGGDEVFSPDNLDNRRVYHPDWSEDPPTIDQIVIQYVEDGRHLQDGAERDSVAADDNFTDLSRKFLWTFLGSLNAAYNQVAITNPQVNGEPGYDRSQLTVQSTDQLNIEGRLGANADSRNHGWNNDLNVQYAAARIADDDAGFEETSDQIRLRSRYRYKRLRADLEGKWYIPDPVVEGQLETEFSNPDTRDWHRVDLRGILAASFQLAEPLDIRLGGNVRQDINEPEGEPTLGVNASYTLGRITPFRILDRPIRVESEVEYFFNDIGNQNIHETRSSNRIYFAFFEQFFFTTTFNAFLYRDDTVGELGTNTELTIGINYQWDMTYQNF